MTTVLPPTPSPATTLAGGTAAGPAPAASGLRWVLGDVGVLAGRSMRHATRNLDSLLMSVLLPIMLLLLFVFVFGGAMGDRDEYIQYVVPGILLMCAGYGASTTATTTTRTVENRLRARLARTCPASTEPPRIGIERKRSIIPPVM